MTRAARMAVAAGETREDVIHASIVGYIRTTHPDCIVFHPANGGLRSKREAAKLKWLGVLPGVPDIVVLAPTGRVYLLEVKGPKGSLSPDQGAIRDHCERHEIPWAMVRSINGAREALAGWGLIGREVNDDRS